MHITKATLEQLDGEFAYEKGFGEERDDYLKDKGVETFLIADSEVDNFLYIGYDIV